MTWQRIILMAMLGFANVCTGEPTNSFGIYLFANSEDWRESDSNWTSRALSPVPVISDTDVLNYTFTNHLMTLTPDAAQRITELRIPRLIEPFVVVVNGKRIYRGAFVSSFCSQSVAAPSITLWGAQQFTIQTNLPPNSLLIEPYAALFSKIDADPRSDERIKRALAALHKLK
jgi:hypothetical protein